MNETNSRKSRDGNWAPKRGLAVQLCGHVPNPAKCKCSVADCYEMKTTWKCPVRRPPVTGCNGFTCQCNPSVCKCVMANANSGTISTIPKPMIKTGNEPKGSSVNINNNNSNNKDTSAGKKTKQRKLQSMHTMHSFKLDEGLASIEEVSLNEWNEVDIPIFSSETFSPKPHFEPFKDDDVTFKSIQPEPVVYEHRFTNRRKRPDRSLSRIIELTAMYSKHNNTNATKEVVKVKNGNHNNRNNKDENYIPKIKNIEHTRIDDNIIKKYRTKSDNNVIQSINNKLISSEDTLNKNNRFHPPRKSFAPFAHKYRYRKELHTPEHSIPNKVKQNEPGNNYYEMPTVADYMQFINKNIVQSIYKHSVDKEKLLDDKNSKEFNDYIPIVEDHVERENILLMMVKIGDGDNVAKVNRLLNNQTVEPTETSLERKLNDEIKDEINNKKSSEIENEPINLPEIEERQNENLYGESLHLTTNKEDSILDIKKSFNHIDNMAVRKTESKNRNSKCNIVNDDRKEVIDRASSPINVLPLYSISPQIPIITISDTSNTITSTRIISSDKNVDPVTTISRKLDDDEIIGTIKNQYSKEVVKEFNASDTSVDCFGNVTLSSQNEPYNRTVSREDIVVYNTIRSSDSEHKRIFRAEKEIPVNKYKVNNRVERKVKEERNTSQKKKKKREKECKPKSRHSSRERTSKNKYNDHRKSISERRQFESNRVKLNGNPCVINIFNQTRNSKSTKYSLGDSTCDRCHREIDYTGKRIVIGDYLPIDQYDYR